MFRFLQVTALLCIITLQSFGGSISGVVTDANTSELLIGCTISIDELTIGTCSGLDGSYIIKNIKPGTYTLTCSYISYAILKKKITISDSSTFLKIDFNLLPSSIEIDEVAIISTNDLSTEKSARNSEKRANSILNVVSHKTIELSPDLNLAGVVQRMSGITIESASGSNAKYALMRGMDKRYNYTLINGIKIPSTNNKHRYVSLDMFPSDLIERVEVSKSLTPDMEGDAIAGVINLRMKDAPEKLLIQANVSSGYNFFFSDNNYTTFNTKAINWKSPYEINGKGYYASVNEFPINNLKYITNEIPIDQYGSITLGNRFFNKKLGVIASGIYSTKYTGKNSLKFDDDITRDELNLPVLTKMQERVYSQNKTSYGIHNKIDYSFNSRNKIQLYTAYMNLSTTQIRESDNLDLSVSYKPENGSTNSSHTTRFRYNIQSLYNSTLHGEHTLTKKLLLDWSVVYSKATNQIPDEVSISYGTNTKNYEPYNWYVDFDGSNHLWRHNSDEDKAAYLNLTHQTELFGMKTEFKAGGLYRQKERESFYNSYTLQAITNVETADTSYVSYYSEKGVDWDNYTDIKWKIYNPRGTIATGENFNADETVIAGYAMFQLQSKKIHAIGGFRVEHTKQGYYMEYPIGQPTPDGELVYTDILPSLQIKYKVLDKHTLRASYYRATNKPGFLEIVPCPVVDDNDLKSKGNPDVKHSVADNFDLRWEYFPSTIDQVLIGFFVKNISNPIEFAYVRDGSSQDIVFSPINSDNSINKGMEIDVIKYFREFGIKGNYTYTSSSITTNKLSYTRDENGDVVPDFYVSQERSLYGQSEHVGNISLLYKGSKNGFNAQLAFSYTGDRIYTISQYIDNDLWQKGYWQLDLSAEKKFKQGISVFVKAHNLLNTKLTAYILKTNEDNSEFPDHDASDTSTLVRLESSAQSVLAGIRYNF